MLDIKSKYPVLFKAQGILRPPSKLLADQNHSNSLRAGRKVNLEAVRSQGHQPRGINTQCRRPGEAVARGGLGKHLPPPFSLHLARSQPGRLPRFYIVE